MHRSLHVAGLVTGRRRTRTPLPPLPPLSPTHQPAVVNGNVDQQHKASGAAAGKEHVGKEGVGKGGAGEGDGGDAGKSTAGAAQGTSGGEKHDTAQQDTTAAAAAQGEGDHDKGVPFAAGADGDAERARDAGASRNNNSKQGVVDDPVSRHFEEVYMHLGEELLAQIPCREAHAAVVL